MKHMLATSMVSVGLCLASHADDGLAYATTYVESFSGAGDYLTGALKPSSDGTWTVSIDDGVAWLVNDQSNAALRNYNLPTVPVAFAEDNITTDAAVIEARVSAEASPDGGVGLMIGYPNGEGYLAFTVGTDRRFRILRKQDGRLSAWDAGTDEAIEPNGFNLVRIERSTHAIDFMVNGTSVYRFEADDEDWAAAPVGIAAFGRGRFGFDEVRVEPADIADLAIRAAAQNTCGLPAIPSSSRLVTVGIYEGQAVSSIGLAGLDEVTTSAALHIEQGETPLYLIVNAYDSLLWRLEGDADRVAHVAVIGPVVDGKVASGVLGVDAGIVSFHRQTDCVRSAYDVDSPEFRLNNALLALWTGHAPFVTFGEYDLNAMSIPSGVITEPEAAQGIAPEWDTEIVAEALRFNPAGIFDSDPTQIVTESAVIKLKVLPQHFGLAQLIASGALVRDGLFYRITAPMRYPAGLYGAHSVNFTIEPGVVEPTGTPGHSQVERLEERNDVINLNLNGAGSIITLQ